MIQTTVVGSYPVPAWLRVYNTRESLRDAMMVVLKTQELAGIDVVADGELYRWDITPRDQRDDRLFRPAAPGGPGRADPRSVPGLEAEDRHGLPVAAGRDCHGPARPRAAQPRATMRFTAT